MPAGVRPLVRRSVRVSTLWVGKTGSLVGDREGLRSRGLIGAGDTPPLTDAGRELRQWVEDRTDQRAVVAYQALGEDGCQRLRSLGRAFSRAVVDSGVLAMDRLGRV